MNDEYTPSTEEIREQYWVSSGDPRRSSEAWAEFDRWLAAHDAEVRAEQADHDAMRINGLDTRLAAAKRKIAEMWTGVVAEEPEWEYGTALRTPNGSLWDFEYEGPREAAEWHVRACAKDGHDHGMDECVIVRRSRRISVGEWVPISQEGAGYEGDA